MTAIPGTVHIVLDGLRNVLAPLSNRLTVTEAPTFFARLGVPMTDAQAASLAGPLEQVRTGVTNFVRSVDDLDGVLESGELGRLIAGQAGAIVGLSAVFTGLPALGTAVGALPGAPPNFAATFPQRIFDHQLTTVLAQNVALNEILELTGILDRVDVEPPDPAQDPFTVDTLHIGRIGDWLTDPGTQLASRFDWNADGFTGTKLLTALDRFFAMLGMPVLLDLSGPAPVLDLVYSTIRPRLDLTPPGIAISLDMDTQPLSAELTGPGWKFTVSVEFSLPRGTEIVLQPGGAVTVTLPEATTTAGSVRIGFTKTGVDAGPLLLFGIPGASRLEAAEVGVELVAGLRWAGSQARGEIGVRGVVKGGKLVVDVGDGDGFLSTIIPGRLENDFEVAVGYSADDGLHFEGSSVLKIQLPAHLDLGPVELTGMGLSFGIEGDRFPIGLTADVKAELGPLTAVVAGVGFGADLRLADGQQGNLGPLDLSLRFQPPTGVGLSLDVAIVSGGGFLYFDPKTEEYGGVLELEFAGIVAVKAIGLITTRMPDGSKGFSLLIVLTAEFGGGGIQLGFGFTLLGVGGILGLNRRMDLDALVEGVVTGSVQSVMFPKDVVANAPRIISDLRKFFPPEDGTFLVGPMAKIGWGTPTLVVRLARGDRRGPAREHRDPGRARVRAAQRGHPVAGAAGQLRRRARGRQVAVVVLREAVRLAHPRHDHRRWDGPAGHLGRQPRLRAVGRRVPPRVHPAAAAVPGAAPAVGRHPELAGAADPGVRLLRRHQQHRPVRREGRAAARAQRLRRSRATSASTRCSGSRRSRSSSRSPPGSR